MSSVIELFENYDNGSGTISRFNTETRKRFLLVDPYDGWQSVPGVPEINDFYPGDDELQLSQISYRGYGQVAGSTGYLGGGYTHCKLELTYSKGGTASVAGVSKDLAGELLSLGHVGYFASSGTPVDAAIVILVSMGSLTITLDPVSPEPTSALMALLGKINSDTWTPDGEAYAYGVGTVLFAGYKSRRVAGGYYNLEYDFKINPQGWNNSLDPSTGNWDTVLLQPSGEVVFASAAFGTAGIGI
jgi:hypothetical protein